MDLVYSRAFATIVAMDGLDADAGLPGIRPGTRTPQPVQNLRVSDTSANLEYDQESEAIEDIHIVATPKRFGVWPWTDRNGTRAAGHFKSGSLRPAVYISRQKQCTSSVIKNTQRVREPRIGKGPAKAILRTLDLFGQLRGPQRRPGNTSRIRHLQEPC